MKLYSTIILKSLILFFAGFFVCCTPQARLNRILKNHPYLRESAIVTYTIAAYSFDSTITAADYKSEIQNILNTTDKLTQVEKMDLSQKINTLFDTTTRVYKPIKVGNKNGDSAHVYQDKSGIHLKLFNKGTEAKTTTKLPVIRECEHEPLRIFFFGLIVGIVLMILFIGWITKTPVK